MRILKRLSILYIATVIIMNAYNYFLKYVTHCFEKDKFTHEF